jgi:hypothetical protein
LKDFPRNNLHAFVESDRVGFKGGMDRLGQGEIKFPTQLFCYWLRHLGVSLHRVAVVGVAVISVTAARRKADDRTAASMVRTALDAMPGNTRTWRFSGLSLVRYAQISAFGRTADFS